MKPYYEHAGITIYHGDCREFLDLRGDVLLTDPPYGLQLGHTNNRSKNGGYGGHLGKKSYRSYVDSYENFTGQVVPALNAFIQNTDRAAVFTGPHIHEQKKPDAIGGIFSPASTGRTPWGSKNFLPILLYGAGPRAGQHRPTVIQSTAISDVSIHPCPKPIAWMRWLVNLASIPSDLVIDPFMGSGTSLFAAKQMGRRAIGIETEEAYCEEAAKRLSQEVFNFSEEGSVKCAQSVPSSAFQGSLCG